MHEDDVRGVERDGCSERVRAEPPAPVLDLPTLVVVPPRLEQSLGGHELRVPPVERQLWIAVDIGREIPKTGSRIEETLPGVRPDSDQGQGQIRGHRQPADLQRLRPLELLPDKAGENDEGRNEVDKHSRAKRMSSPPLALVHGHGERVYHDPDGAEPKDPVAPQ